MQQDLMVEKMQAVVQDLESPISDITSALASQWDNLSTDKEDTSMGKRQRGEGGYFSGLCWVRVNTTHEGVGGYFSPPVLGPCEHVQ